MIFVLLLVLFVMQNQRQAVIALLYRLHNLKVVADRVGKQTVFNIGGNKARLIAAIHYNTHRIYIRRILIHAEYSKGNWRE